MSSRAVPVLRPDNLPENLAGGHGARPARRRTLLARSPHFRPGMFSALAGFVEAGETVEHAAVREVREEVGIEIANLRYFQSQPWPFRIR